MFYVANHHRATLFFGRSQCVCAAARHVPVNSSMTWPCWVITLAVVHVWLALLCVFACALLSPWLDRLHRHCWMPAPPRPTRFPFVFPPGRRTSCFTVLCIPTSCVLFLFIFASSAAFWLLSCLIGLRLAFSTCPPRFAPSNDTFCSFCRFDFVTRTSWTPIAVAVLATSHFTSTTAMAP